MFINSDLISCLKVCVLACAVLLGACSSSDDDSASADAANVGIESNTMSGTENTISAENVPLPAPFDTVARALSFDYEMPAVGGGQTIAQALLLEPLTDAPAQGRSLVVWAHGTTGIANSCAPSEVFPGLSNTVPIQSLLEAGYAVLAPDYEGFGTPTIHPYYVRSSHANSVLSAVPAAHELEGVSLSSSWAMVGHSQGGHVVLAAARGPQNPAFPLEAVVALAPGTDLQSVSDRQFEAIDLALAEGDFFTAESRTFYLNAYSAFVAHAMQLASPEIDPDAFFGEDMLPLINTALDEAECGEFVRSVSDALNNHFAAGGTLGEFDGLRRDWPTIPGVAAFIEDQVFADEAQSAPLLIVQGDLDRQIPVAATTDFVNQQRAIGTDVDYQIVEGARHGDVAVSEIMRTITWLDDVFPSQ